MYAAGLTFEQVVARTGKEWTPSAVSPADVERDCGPAWQQVVALREKVLGLGAEDRAALEDAGSEGFALGFLLSAGTGGAYADFTMPRGYLAGQVAAVQALQDGTVPQEAVNAVSVVVSALPGEPFGMVAAAADAAFALTAEELESDFAARLLGPAAAVLGDSWQEVVAGQFRALPAAGDQVEASYQA